MSRKELKESRLEDDLFDPDVDVEEQREGYPVRNDLVIATVTDVADHGCYVTLDEFNNKRAYVHISELSRTWVKNIRVHVRQGQRIVAKVLRIDPYKNQIDLSIKRVPDQMKKLKLLESKRTQTGNNLFKMIVEKIPAAEQGKAEEIKNILIQNFEILYYGLEFATKNPIKELIDLGIDENWAKTIHSIAIENIIQTTVEIRGSVEIVIPGGDGIMFIKEALIAGRDNVKEKNTKINIYTEGSPKYTIEVKSEDYKIAEKALENALIRIEEVVKMHDGTFTFTRRK